MKVILREEVTKLGNPGDAVTVRDGFARNYLVPRGLAYVATSGALKKIEHEMRLRARVIERERMSATEFAQKLEGVTVTIPMRVGEEDRLYGSVTGQMISDSIGNQGYEIDRRAIVLADPIRTLGVHEVAVHLKHGVVGKIRVNVIAE
ncbi:MAG: 50S ribosomal protein L9 [Bacteroidota bacterium]|nr:50S ribosomal protein L9 [Bacteroidota bacterium]MDP4232787.1 50S ribosomal protein L9 [Bacteroidota bacterium]MDP4242532.1 50S ribosomal protein L9 [Bacteroidota bacterium]MDP4288889.1 50S ribosomal protein L9 [Bacteroidota bacterium]